MSVTTILLSWKSLIHLSWVVLFLNPSMAWRFKQIQLWGNQDHADQSILSYLPLSKQLSRCMWSFCQNHRAATHAQLKYNHVLQWKVFERAPAEPRPYGSNTAVWMNYFIKRSVPYFVDREFERSLKAGWFVMWEVWLMETWFVVYSMPHNKSAFKGLTKGTQKAWISSFVYLTVEPIISASTMKVIFFILDI